MQTHAQSQKDPLAPLHHFSRTKEQRRGRRNYGRGKVSKAKNPTGSTAPVDGEITLFRLGSDIEVTQLKNCSHHVDL